MNKLMLVLACLAVAGCKKKGGADAAAKMTEFKDAMCKCAAGDTACANTVLEGQKKWGEEMAKTAGDNKPDPEAAKALEPVMTEYTKCMTAAMTPATPPAKPEAPKPAKSTEVLGDKLSLEFVKEDGGDAVFKVTNNSASCDIKSIGYSGYAYDKSGKKLGAGGAGMDLSTPFVHGTSQEMKFSASSHYDKTAIAEIVVTAVTCADGSTWDDSARAMPDRPMAGKH